MVRTISRVRLISNAKQDATLRIHFSEITTSGMVGGELRMNKVDKLQQELKLHDHKHQ